MYDFSITIHFLSITKIVVINHLNQSQHTGYQYKLHSLTSKYLTLKYF
ncbi:hypothetical protein SAMN04487910_4063 [Aquimarina amphilecti]|uniref:Uncharacterized protein n=1 Tax=Aquimarina amphilecti TaxID=1038014 RepID=A0A1H7VE12_AQUAM|nr:hypothetical protein SAMN04487910_4063 [Aquimarina amphilecti]